MYEMNLKKWCSTKRISFSLISVYHNSITQFFQKVGKKGQKKSVEYEMKGKVDVRT